MAQMADVLHGLNIDAGGVMHPPITQAAIQACTALSGSFAAQGYTQAAQTLREYAQQAAALLPPVDQKVTTPAIPDDLRQKLNVAISLERDPVKLRQWAATLRALPRASDPEVQVQIQWLEATASQIEQQQAAAAALQAIDQTINDGAILKPLPIPVPPTPISDTAPGATPALPAPPAPKSSQEVVAGQLATHLWAMQNQYQNPKAAKSHVDKTMVKRFQNAVGLTADGNAGPGTYIAMASYGQGNLPLVMIWPKGATQATVSKYQDGLEVVAQAADQKGDAKRAMDIRATASREKGQGGVG
jgi:murein L,D-transpeptidase YcbB/YkuD